MEWNSMMGMDMVPKKEDKYECLALLSSLTS